MENEYPACFGVLENVFPRGDDGLRHSPESCFACYCKTECLQKAMEGSPGLKLREELVDRAYDSKVMGFFKRWSKKKEINRKLSEKNRED